MEQITSGGFSSRDKLTQSLIQAVSQTILTEERYTKIETGIEFRFGEEAKLVHEKLYNSLGPTTDLLRYFPDALFFDHSIKLPTWDFTGQVLSNDDDKGLFTFYVEYKYTGTQCPFSVNGVPAEFVGQIEREAWLTYKRLTSPNPELGIYLDGQRTRIALFYAAPFAPDKLYAEWEEKFEPIKVKPEVAIPGERALKTRGSGTPWINFDIRSLKPLDVFLIDDLYWNSEAALIAVQGCKYLLFGK